MTKEKHDTPASEIDDQDLDAAQGGFVGGLFGSDGGVGKVTFQSKDFRAISSGPAVPGMNLMEGEEEELQTRPSPDLTANLGKIVPRGPGIK